MSLWRSEIEANKFTNLENPQSRNFITFVKSKCNLLMENPYECMYRRLKSMVQPAGLSFEGHLAADFGSFSAVICPSWLLFSSHGSRSCCYRSAATVCNALRAQDQHVVPAPPARLCIRFTTTNPSSRLPPGQQKSEELLQKPLKNDTVRF